MDRLRRKLLSIISTFALFLQILNPFFLVIPQSVLADSLNSKVTFDSGNNSFTVSVNTANSVAYILAYWNGSQINAIQGNADASSSNFSRQIYAGTKSANGAKVPDNVVRGIFKVDVSASSWLDTQEFTVNNGQVSAVSETTPTSLDLTNDENNWLKTGSSITPTPTAAPTLEPTAAATPTPTLVETPTPTASPEATPTATATPTITPNQTVNGQIAAAIIKNKNANSLLVFL